MPDPKPTLNLIYEDKQPTNSYKITFTTSLPPGTYTTKWYRREPLQDVFISSHSYYIPNISDIGCILKLKLFSISTKSELISRKIGPIRCHYRLLERLTLMKDKTGLKMPVTIKSIQLSVNTSTNLPSVSLKDKTKSPLLAYFKTFHPGTRKYSTLKAIITIGQDGLKLCTRDKRTIIRAKSYDPVTFSMIPNNCTEFEIIANDPLNSGKQYIITLNSTTLFDRDFLVAMWRQNRFKYCVGRQSAILGANINSWYEKGMVMNAEEISVVKEVDQGIEEEDEKDGEEENLENVRTFTSSIIDTNVSEDEFVNVEIEEGKDPFDDIFKLEDN